MNNRNKIKSTTVIDIFEGVIVILVIIAAAIGTLLALTNQSVNTIEEQTALIQPPIQTEIAVIDRSIEENIVIDEEELVIKDKEYTVQSGDNLYSICEKIYNSGDYCYALGAYNGIEFDGYIYEQQILKIPDINNFEFIEIYEQQKIAMAERRKKEIATISVNRSGSSLNHVSKNGKAKNNTGYVDTSSYTYLGNYKITGYTPGCQHCCGNTAGKTSSGTQAVVGRTIAAKGLNYGQKVYIKGYGYYVVEDTGAFKSNTIDIAASSHDECYSLTNSSGVDVYLVN